MSHLKNAQGRDGKSYSIRHRVTDDPDIPSGLVEDQ